MDVQIKKTVRAGNSSAVVLPRAWLNKEVRVELIKKTPEMILFDVLGVIKEHINLKEVIGIYLTGSYARGEEDEESDIDILVITENSDKEMINEGIYNILIVSVGLLNQKLKKDLFPIGQMIKEAKPLLNSNYLDSIEIKVTKDNVKWYLDSTKDKLKIIEHIIEKKDNKTKVNDKIIYTLILRIRTLYIIEKLIKNENYSKRDFIRIIMKIANEERIYERYLAVKNNGKEKNEISIEETKKLYEYLKNELDKISGLVKKLK